MRKFAIWAALAVTIAAPLAAQSAKAPTGKNGWGDARWGMSVADVLKPLGPKGAATDLMDTKTWLGTQHQGVSSTTDLNGYSYEVKYYFTPDQSKLSGVTIGAKKKADCDSLEAHFIQHLGAGKRTTEPLRLDEGTPMTLAMREWSESKNGNAFQFIYITDTESPVVFCRVRISEPTVNWSRTRA